MTDDRHIQPHTEPAGFITRLRALAAEDEAHAPLPPHLGDVNVSRNRWILTAGSLALLATVAWVGEPRLWLTAGVAVVAAAVAHAIFLLSRRRKLHAGTLVREALLLGTLLSLLLPGACPLWMVAAGAGFGAVFGREVFGGFASAIFHPVLVAWAFLSLSYDLVAFGPASIIQTGLAGPICFGVGVAVSLIVLASGGAWRITLAIVTGAFACTLVLATSLSGQGDMPTLQPAGLMLLAVLVAADPCNAPHTRAGQWLVGVGVGVMAAAGPTLANVATGPGEHLDALAAMIFALLLGNVFAPVIDQAATALATRRRKGRAAA